MDRSTSCDPRSHPCSTCASHLVSARPARVHQSFPRPVFFGIQQVVACGTETKLRSAHATHVPSHRFPNASFLSFSPRTWSCFVPPRLVVRGTSVWIPPSKGWMDGGSPPISPFRCPSIRMRTSKADGTNEPTKGMGWVGKQEKVQTYVETVDDPRGTGGRNVVGKVTSDDRDDRLCDGWNPWGWGSRPLRTG